MTQVRLIKDGTPATLESNINNFLESIIKHEIIDIKYSSVYNGTTAVYSALIIYR
ncbi:sporulation protein Cse60 [Neobacillus novalis]|uniref:Sporulation protein Cse60 n=1 Tax=Neobacillus novalis TaxID=220687 RepID=A0AA95SJH8_9BACI|nr:sporulation protein Cse60 [Neobacillus novalis]WHY88721.1 sporulation protein Cse60 [Neobacillus novalis]